MTEPLTTNVVPRLRAGESCAEMGQQCRSMTAAGGCLCAIAADEIDRLTERLAGAYASVNLLTEMHEKAVAEVAELRRDAEAANESLAAERIAFWETISDLRKAIENRNARLAALGEQP